MLSNKVIGRYAKALFELASETKQTEKVFSDVILINEIVMTNNDLVMMLASPIIKTDKKLAILKAIFEKHICDLSLAYILLITKKRREVYIPSIAEQFVILYKELKGIKKAHLVTSVAIDEKTKASIIDRLKAFTNNQIELVEEINPDIIGGFILSFDNKQYDASIAKEFQLLSKEFNIKETKNN